MTATQPRESLYVIETTLSALENLRNEAVAEGDTEALAAIDKEICSYLSKASEKIDSYCDLMRKLDDVDKACKQEARRLLDRATAARNFRDRLKELAVYAMNAIGARVLESRVNKLRIQLNGGLEPLDVDMSILPTQYKRIQVQMPVSLWGEMLSSFADDARMQRIKAGEPEPDNELIREALKVSYDAVPGARLLERGEHLRIS